MTHTAEEVRDLVSRISGHAITVAEKAEVLANLATYADFLERSGKRRDGSHRQVPHTDRQARDACVVRGTGAVRRHRMTKHITQREARELKRRVAQFEIMEDRRRNAWATDYPGGVNIYTAQIPSDMQAVVHTARLLKHAVVATLSSDRSLRLYALPLGSGAK